ncbi:MAG: ABC-2 family transporter protein [Patescibacteria group bacterium]
MLQELRFAFRAIKKNIKGSAELRTSFLVNIIGMSINNIAFIILWVFFVKSVGIINGWEAMDIVGLLGFGAFSYGLVFSVGAGLRKIADYVANGGFDRFMLSPKNLIIRIATSFFNASAVGDMVFGMSCLIIYMVFIQANLVQIFLIILLIFISALVFLSATITIYSASFLFTDANAITGSLFELFMTPTLFHGGAFQGLTRFIFTFLIPSLLIGTLPVEIVKNISLSVFSLVLVLSFLWFILGIKLFYWGVKRYESTNFMTFGS